VRLGDRCGFVRDRRGAIELGACAEGDSSLDCPRRPSMLSPGANREASGCSDAGRRGSVGGASPEHPGRKSGASRRAVGGYRSKLSGELLPCGAPPPEQAAFQWNKKINKLRK